VAITLAQLGSFLAVVRSGSITAAADELVVTQPSVSAAVSALSKEIGVDLTERIGRGVRPSPAGRAFVPYAADVLGLLRQGEQAAREAADADRTRLRISAVTTAGEFIVAPLIEGFAARFPGLDITLHVGNRDEVFGRVADHESDVAISGRPPDDGRLVGQPFADADYVLITSPRDPLAARRSLPPGELSQRSWLLREQGSGTRTLCEQYLALNDLEPRILTLGSNGAIKHAVRTGLGVSLQSRVAVELELRSRLLATIAVRGGLPWREWHVLRSAVGPVREPTEEFISYVMTDAARVALESWR